MKPIILKQHEVIHLRDHGSVIAWRVVKPQPAPFTENGPPDKNSKALLGLPWMPIGGVYQRNWHCPYGRTGEERWVKETWAADKYYDGRPGNGCGSIPEGVAIECKACPDGVTVLPGRAHRSIQPRGKWRSPVHMPRWASRFTVTLDVGLKRIQEVTEEEARASVTCSEFTGKPYCTNCSGHESLCHKMTLRQTIAKGDENYFTSNPSYFWKITCTLKKP